MRTLHVCTYFLRPRARRVLPLRADARAPADGSLIYRQLGPSAEQEFSKTWGVGYALDNVRSCALACVPARCAEPETGAQQASEWQEVLKTAVKAALILVRASTDAATYARA